ncbi:MAG: heat-inducible transcription repressor HrcA [Candidatus Melainabacteria bacterium HGW-Melainabacteria-1]|nr:MAG: heat-inducible transcription repressor HrcA [Candidatus Melainabacteria bacterium HGW-Melainabacteria-1]
MSLEYRLTDRKKALLSAIIRDYITHGEPLGSRTIVKRHGFTLSPATIRNEMAELEEAGLLYQPHTSAGRIPSHKGYRFFVDYLMEAYLPTYEEQQFLRRLEQTSKAIDAILAQAIRIISEATHGIALAEPPHLRQNPLRAIHIIPVEGNTMVLNLLFGNGIRRQSVLQVSQSLYADVLTLLSNYLNAQLNQGTSLDALFHRLATVPLEREIQGYKDILLEMVSEIYAQAQRDEKVYLSGTSHLLREPEFQSIESAFPILQFLEQEQSIHQLFHRCGESHLQKSHHVYCFIGYENSYEELQNCSFVATPYFIDTKASGMIGVLGPTRMDYPKVMALLQTVAGNITTNLSQLFS